MKIVSIWIKEQSASIWFSSWAWYGLVCCYAISYTIKKEINSKATDCADIKADA